MEKLLRQLLQNTYTKQDLLDKVRTITSGVKGKKKLPPEFKGFKNNLELITPDIIGNLPVVTLTLAIHPTAEEIRQLGQWFRQNVDSQILLDIHQDPEIIGGCRLIWQGFEGDFSLRRKFKK
jgi:hypothetical protein